MSETYNEAVTKLGHGFLYRGVSHDRARMAGGRDGARPQDLAYCGRLPSTQTSNKLNADKFVGLDLPQENSYQLYFSFLN